MNHPDTNTNPVTDNIHGQEVVDNYRWLEDTDLAATKDWVNAQNEHTSSTLDKTGLMNGYKELLKDTYNVDNIGTPIKVGDKYFWFQRLAGEDLGKLYFKVGLDGEEQLLIDLPSMRDDNAVSLDYWTVSIDGKFLAYGISECGDEMATLRVKNVDTKEDTGDVIERARYSSVAWLPDGSGFYYDRCPDKGSVPVDEEHMHSSIYLHMLGDSPSKDKIIFGEGRPKDDMLYGYQLTDDARYLYFIVAKNWNTNALYRYDSKKDSVSVVLEDGLALANSRVIGDFVYLRTNLEANNYKLLRTPNDQEVLPEVGEWELIIPEDEYLLEGVTFSKDFLFSSYLVDSTDKLYSYNYEGESKTQLETPDNSVCWLNCSKYESDYYLTTMSMASPKKVMRYDFKTSTYKLHRQDESSFNEADFRVDKEWAISKDGTKLPMYVLSRKDMPLDEPAPTVLWGYGCHGISQAPDYVGSWLPWVSKGGRYAVSIIRGGGEYGEQWHMDGSLEKKQNTFDDFIACADKLSEAKYTSSDKLAIHGASNGGLMVGAVLTQRPDICKAVVCSVPVLDLYRFHKFLIAGRWVHEFGDPEKADQFKWLQKWSPYHNVDPDTEYPSVFFTTAENDTRVHPLHAKKMAALLQATNKKNPVLLRVEGKAGHAGGSKPVSKVIESQSEKLAYVDWQLGLTRQQ